MTQPRDVLVRFHEIALKGKNRPVFIRALTENLRRATAGLGVERVWAGRMVVRLTLTQNAAWPPIEARIRQVFGAVKFSLTARVSSDYNAIADEVLRTIEGKTCSAFRIASNRANKAFPMTSNALNVALGRLVQERTGWPVDLRNADLAIHVEVLDEHSFIYTNPQQGAGGLPVGTAGRVAVLMSGGIDSPVAAWRMMRRGCTASLIHFHSFPLVEGRSREKAKDLAKLLTAYQFDTRLFLVPFADVQREIILTVPGPYRVVAYRRFMVRIAEAIARREGARALVTGESLGQVGSQTLVNMATIDASADLPMLRPLVGMDKEEIVNQARLINTYETSILPDEDCCALFVPRSPSTAVPKKLAERLEHDLHIDELVKNAVDAAEFVEFHEPALARAGAQI